jgi:molybdopterin molybdotransferase
VGEDAAQGQLLALAGASVTPVLLGLAAAGGYDELLVRPRPLVRVLVSGDELTRSGASGNGRVRDALGPMLPGLIAQLGGEMSELLYDGGHADTLAAALSNAGGHGGASVIVVTGSTSIGVTDRLRPLLSEAGAQFVVDGVACRPGHPQLLAMPRPATWVTGLPGNPFAALVAAHTLLGPLLAGLAARELPRLPVAVLAGEVPPRRGRTLVVPVSWDGRAARLCGNGRPASLQGAALADALAVVAPDWAPGECVQLILSR